MPFGEPASASPPATGPRRVGGVHSIPPCRHRHAPPVERAEHARSSYRRAFTTSGTAVPLPPESMFHFLRIPCSTSRIRCSTSSGIAVPLPPDSVFHFLRNTHSGTMQVVGLGCARRGHDGLHRLDAALNLLPERYLVEMRRRVTIATASRAPPRTPWKPQWYSTSSTWQRRRGVRCSSSAHRRACRHLVRDPMGVDRRTVTLGCSCGGSQLPQAAGALMRTETSHEAREDQRKSPIGR